MSLRGATFVTTDRPGGVSGRLMTHADIVIALIRREFRARFGREWFSFAAGYMAPLAWIAAIYLGFWVFGRTTPVHTDTISFILSGLIPYASFRYVMTAIGKAQSSVRGVLIFPHVTHEHAVAAGALLELANTFLFFIVIWVGNLLIFGNAEMANFPEFAAGVVIAWALGASYGYFFSVLGRGRPMIWQAGQIILRPTFFLSAVFYTGNELPDRIYEFLGWNPLLHAIDTARDGMLFNYQSRVADPAYAIGWVLTLTIAAIVISGLRRR